MTNPTDAKPVETNAQFLERMHSGLEYADKYGKPVRPSRIDFRYLISLAARAVDTVAVLQALDHGDYDGQCGTGAFLFALRAALNPKDTSHE